MDARDRLRLLEDDSKVLERIANQFGETSREYLALKHATFALHYVLLGQGHQWFKDYLEKLEGDLTPEQRKHLIEVGIDPDVH